MMKIGMLTSVDERCGIAHYSNDLCAGFGPEVQVDTVSVYSIRDPWPHYIAQSSERLNKCDVVHIQHDYAFWGSILPRKSKYFAHMKSIKCPKIITAHTLDTVASMFAATESSGMAKMVKNILKSIPSYCLQIENGTFNIADRIIVHDNPAKRVLTGRGISERKIKVIPMGVPEPTASQNDGEFFRQKYDLYGKKLIVVFGFIRPGRGYETILDLLPEMDKETMLVIAGGVRDLSMEWYLTSLHETIRSQNLTQKTLITGYLNEADAGALMQTADIVLCSQESGTGSYSVQFALGYGKPIVASSLPCFKDLEFTYKCLTTYNTGSRTSLASVLKPLLHDNDAAQKLANAASIYAVNHTWEKIASMTENLYREFV
ncbi:MAG: glycosyltransferase [Armatimonadota bacterium]